MLDDLLNVRDARQRGTRNAKINFENDIPESDMNFN